MKKIVILVLSLSLFTGCSQNTLVNYLEAHNNSMEAKTGNMVMDMKADISFNEEGLTGEELVNLSYYDNIEMSIDNTYDARNEDISLIMKSYFNFGGMGFDNTLYIEDENIFMKLPILDGYMKFDEDMYNNDYVNDSYIEENYEEYYEIIKELFEKWSDILQEENIIKDKKTFITTNEGQIKTTMYNINIDKEQLELFKTELVNALENNKELISKPFKKEGVEVDFNEFLDRIEFLECEGLAYVDFDGRLLKEDINLKIQIDNPKKGEPKAIDIDYTINFNNLGEEVELDFPEITDDMLIDEEELNEFMKTLPMSE